MRKVGRKFGPADEPEKQQENAPAIEPEKQQERPKKKKVENPSIWDEEDEKEE